MVRHLLNRLLRLSFRRFRIRYWPKTIHGRRYDLPVEAFSPLMLVRPVKHVDDYEGAFFEAVIDRVRPGQTVFDVGAYTGLYVLALAESVGRDGLVVAFEPNPYNRALLTDTLEKNRILNVRVEAVAVGDASGEAEFWVRGASSSSALHPYHVRGEQEETMIRVPVVRLDDYVARTELKPEIIKIDVEGFELEVLRGATTTLANHVRYVCCEIHPDRMAARQLDPSLIYQLMADLGYKVEQEFRRRKWVEGDPYNVIFGLIASSPAAK